MCKVYFDNKVIVFSREAPRGGGNVVEIEQLQPLEITKVLQKLENNNSLRIISSVPESDFENFCSLFTLMEAAGGLVREPSGATLMIWRNQRWDLPKGHIEEGESYEQCALREVGEETGVWELTSQGLFATTFHIYPYYGEWILKKNRWFSMSASGKLSTEPQLEEGITEARWIDPGQMGLALQSSYSTVVEVINSAK